MSATVGLLSSEALALATSMLTIATMMLMLMMMMISMLLLFLKQLLSMTVVMGIAKMPGSAFAVACHQTQWDGHTSADLQTLMRYCRREPNVALLPPLLLTVSVVFIPNKG